MCCGETPHNNRHRRNTPAPAGETPHNNRHRRNTPAPAGIFFGSDINVIFVIEKNVLWRDAT